MATYVVGDIHGCFREWIQFKSKIERQDANAEFILVGDILDKGPHSFEMLHWAMERIRTGSKFQMVIGNHEVEKLEWLRYVLGNFEKEEWKNSDIARKMLSSDGFEFYRICYEKNLKRQQLANIMDWLEALPIYIEKKVNTSEGVQNYIITHNKLPVCENVNVNYNYQFEHDTFSDDMQQMRHDYIVIHGHIPTSIKPCKSAGAVPGKICIQEGDINVDCGLVYGVSKTKGLYGDLAAIRLEDLQEFYYYNHTLKRNI